MKSAKQVVDEFKKEMESLTEESVDEMKKAIETSVEDGPSFRGEDGLHFAAVIYGVPYNRKDRFSTKKFENEICEFLNETGYEDAEFCYDCNEVHGRVQIVFVAKF